MEEGRGSHLIEGGSDGRIGGGGRWLQMEGMEKDR